MYIIFTLLLLVTLFFGFIMFLKPSIAQSLFRVKWGRVKIALATLGSAFMLVMATGLTAPALPETANVDNTASETEAVIKAIDAPTVEPPPESDHESVQVIELKTDLPEAIASDEKPTSVASPAQSQIAESEPVIAPVVTSEPEVMPMPASITTCNCAGPDLDCSDFATHNAAQEVYECCMKKVGSDVYRLDGNPNNGLACESRP